MFNSPCFFKFFTIVVLFILKNLGSNLLFSQSITGIWRGELLIKENSTIYNIEFNIFQQKNSFFGKSFTYQKTNFSAKTLFKVKILNNGECLISEYSLKETSNISFSEICLVKYKLKYKSTNKIEELVGTFQGTSNKSGIKCSAGSIKLVRKKASLFLKNKEDTYTKPKEITNVENIISTPQLNFNKLTQELDTDKDSLQHIITSTSNSINLRIDSLIGTFSTNSENITVSIFDNGIIDKDSVSINILGNRKVDTIQLGIAPFKLIINLSPKHPALELIISAINLGEIPPNTSVLVIESNSKRVEIPISVDFTRNIKLRFRYSPKVIFDFKRY